MACGNFPRMGYGRVMLSKAICFIAGYVSKHTIAYVDV